MKLKESAATSSIVDLLRLRSWRAVAWASRINEINADGGGVGLLTGEGKPKWSCSVDVEMDEGSNSLALKTD